MLEEAGLRERFAEQRIQFRGEGQPVDGGRLFFCYTANGPLLDEFALERQEWGKLIVPGLERLYFFCDAKQFADKIFDVRSDFNDQLGRFFGRKLAGIDSGLEQTLVRSGTNWFQI